jgi:hypothetical protein
MRSTTAILGFLLLGSALQAGGLAQNEGFGNSASLVSRDALLFVWVDDREAVSRRAANTALGRALEEYDSEELSDLFTLCASESSIFLAPAVVRTFGFVLGRGRGEVALSVEGVTTDGDRFFPELLAIADSEGLEPLLEVLARLAKGDDDAADALEEMQVPFEIDLDHGVKPRTALGHGGYEFVVGGKRIVVFVHGERVIAAGSIATIERAIQRAENPSFGSLRDSLRYRETWRALEPGRGSLVVYANLRRFRQEARAAIADVSWVRDLFEERLAAFDGIGIAVRGSGDRFEAAIELERGRTTGEEALLGPNLVFDYPSQLAGTTLALNIRLPPKSAAGWAKKLLWLGGNTIASKAVDEFVLDCGGEGAFEPITRALDGEFSVFLIGKETSADPMPRIGVRYSVRDRALLLKALDVLSTAFPERVRRGKFGGEALYSLKLAGALSATEPTFVVRDDHLLAATSPNHLRILLDDLAKRPRIERDPVWLTAWDYAHKSALDPAVAHGFGDSVALAETLPIWISPLFPEFSDHPRLGPLVAELFHALGDPDIQDALGSIVLRAESRPSGVRVELHGP